MQGCRWLPSRGPTAPTLAPLNRTTPNPAALSTEMIQIPECQAVDERSRTPIEFSLVTSSGTVQVIRALRLSSAMLSFLAAEHLVASGAVAQRVPPFVDVGWVPCGRLAIPGLRARPPTEKFANRYATAHQLLG